MHGRVLWIQMSLRDHSHTLRLEMPQDRSFCFIQIICGTVENHFKFFILMLGSWRHLAWLGINCLKPDVLVCTQGFRLLKKPQPFAGAPLKLPMPLCSPVKWNCWLHLAAQRQARRLSAGWLKWPQGLWDLLALSCVGAKRTLPSLELLTLICGSYGRDRDNTCLSYHPPSCLDSNGKGGITDWSAGVAEDAVTAGCTSSLKVNMTAVCSFSCKLVTTFRLLAWCWSAPLWQNTVFSCCGLGMKTFDLHAYPGPHRMWRHNFSRLSQSQLHCSPQFSQDYHIFEPRAEDFTLSITHRGRSPSRNGLPKINKSLFPWAPNKPMECCLLRLGTKPHIHPLLGMSPVTRAAWHCHTDLPLVLGVKVTARLKTLPERTTPSYLWGRQWETVCNPCISRSCAVGNPSPAFPDQCQIQLVFPRSHQFAKISALRGSYDGKGPAPTLQSHREGIRMDH